ncbi:hypothetical protein AMK34_07795 [Amycolatopsis sp. CB00013]|nr:hypothetical protein AMK34_07795 [Amycolatopsis sp. CB00013]
MQVVHVVVDTDQRPGQYGVTVLDGLPGHHRQPHRDAAHFDEPRHEHLRHHPGRVPALDGLGDMNRQPSHPVEVADGVDRRRHDPRIGRHRRLRHQDRVCVFLRLDLDPSQGRAVGNDLARQLAVGFDQRRACPVHHVGDQPRRPQQPGDEPVESFVHGPDPRATGIPSR